MAITKLVLNGTEYEIGSNTYNSYEITTEGPQLYDGRELSEYTWAELSEKSFNGDFDDLRVGDYKTIITAGTSYWTSQTVKMQIAGINTYYRTCDTQVSYPHIDWISVDCMSDTVQWNTSNNNNGDSTNASPYMVSNLYTYLMDSTNGLVAAVSSSTYGLDGDSHSAGDSTDLSSYMVPKRMLMESRYSSSATLTDSTSWVWNEIGEVWVPTEYEVFGSVVWGTVGYSSGQAVQYPIFANGWQHRIKGAGNGGSRCAWWLATVRSGSSTICCGVNTDGRAYANSASTSYYVPVCFRTGGNT